MAASPSGHRGNGSAEMGTSAGGRGGNSPPADAEVIWQRLPADVEVMGTPPGGRRVMGTSPGGCGGNSRAADAEVMATSPGGR